MFGSIDDELGTDEIEMSFTSLTPLMTSDDATSSSSASDSDANKVLRVVKVLSSVPREGVGASLFRSMSDSSSSYTLKSSGKDDSDSELNGKLRKSRSSISKSRSLTPLSLYVGYCQLRSESSGSLKTCFISLKGYALSVYRVHSSADQKQEDVDSKHTAATDDNYSTLLDSDKDPRGTMKLKCVVPVGFAVSRDFEFTDHELRELHDETKAKLEARASCFELALYTRNFFGPKAMIFTFDKQANRDQWVDTLNKCVESSMGEGLAREKAQAAQELKPLMRDQIIDEAQALLSVLQHLEESVSFHVAWLGFLKVRSSLSLTTISLTFLRTTIPTFAQRE